MLWENTGRISAAAAGQPAGAAARRRRSERQRQVLVSTWAARRQHSFRDRFTDFHHSIFGETGQYVRGNSKGFDFFCALTNPAAGAIMATTTYAAEKENANELEKAISKSLDIQL